MSLSKLTLVEENILEKNECINCQHYEDCGRPERPVKCMGYEEKCEK